MSKLNHIFAQPEHVEGVGNIYPILLKDYDEFDECSKILYISKNHFMETELPLLALMYLSHEQLGYSLQDLLISLERLFTLVAREKMDFYAVDENLYIFANETQDRIVDFSNYEQVRKIIMKQNLMFEQKVYKNPKVQEWAMKVIKAKQKNAPNITVEDMITTVSGYKHIHYDEMQERYTVYQLYADFYRYRKTKRHDSDVIFRSVGDERTIEDFAESLDLFHNPYDDLFVSKDKLGKLNQALKQ